MAIAVRSLAKINLGLYIGAPRPDGFHDLRTVYQTISLHDVVRVGFRKSSATAIEIACSDPRVPLDSSNTCHRMAERVLDALGVTGKVSIEIEKRLPVQGGLGAASSNAVATMVALEVAIKTARGQRKLSDPDRLRIAAAVGSDLALFLLGGTVLGVGRGEEVYPLSDLPALAVVVVMPEVGVSTAQAFADWDARGSGRSSEPSSRQGSADTRDRNGDPAGKSAQLTRSTAFDRLSEVGGRLSSWLTDVTYPNTGASAKGGSRVGKLLSGLVRTGIENDFEKVVFPQYPELRDIKGALERAGAKYASLSGSGSTVYGLFETKAQAERASARLRRQGVRAEACGTLTRQSFRKRSVAGRAV